MPNAADVIDGVIAAWTADATIGNVGLWLGTAKDRAGLPYATLSVSGGEREYLMGAGNVQDFTISIAMHHTNDSTLRTYHAAVQTLFDRKTLALDNGSIIVSRLHYDLFFASPDNVTKDGELIYTSVNTFRSQGFINT